MYKKKKKKTKGVIKSIIKSIQECKCVKCNGWWFLCLYKEDRVLTFKNTLQSLQYSLTSLQFLIFAGNSLKIMAADC